MDQRSPPTRRALLAGLAIALTLCVMLYLVVFALAGLWFVPRWVEERVVAVRPTATAAPTPFPSPSDTITPLPTATALPAVTSVPLPTASPVTASPTAAASRAPAPAQTDLPATDAVTDPELARALTSNTRDLLAAHPDAPRIAITARLDPATRTISGTQTIIFTNTDNVTLDAIYLRLFANAAYFEQGGTVVEDVRVDGAPADTMLELQETALRVGLPRRLGAGERVTLELRFVTTVPDADAGYGIFGVSESGTFALYHWYPELAAYERGGWLLNPPVAQGDATNTDAANYLVTLVAPRGYVLAASGTQIAADETETTTRQTFAAPLARAFAVVAGERLAQIVQRVGEVTVTSYYEPGHAAGGQATLDAAAHSLELFGRRFAPYPYNELDVVEVDLGGGAAGMEATGLVMIGSAYYPTDAANPLDELGSMVPGVAGANVLVFTTAHEVAHQWWFSVVGSDPYREPWLDESLTNWSSALYVDEALGEQAGLVARDLFLRAPYLSLSEDRPLNLPVDAYSSEEYVAIVYGKGALMYDVLRHELGDETFFAFLRRYEERHRFQRATAESWLQTLNEVAGRDMTPFFERWVTSASITEADLPPPGPLSQLLEAGWQ